MKPIPLPDQLLRLCYEHGSATYPDEGCGVLSGPIEQPELLTGFHPLENTLGKLHAADPENFPRTPGEGYVLDALAYVRLEKALQADGHRIKVIFHTHVEVGAYFSEEDRKRATWNGDPLFPGIFYLVCGVKNRAPDGAILAMFDEKTGDFQEHVVEKPRRRGKAPQQ